MGSASTFGGIMFAGKATGICPCGWGIALRPIAGIKRRIPRLAGDMWRKRRQRDQRGRGKGRRVEGLLAGIFLYIGEKRVYH